MPPYSAVPTTPETRTKSEEGSQPIISLTRLRHTFSTKSHFYKTSSRLQPSTSPNEELAAESSFTPSADSKRKWKAKLTPFERFLQLTKRKKDGTIEFPPSEWLDCAPPDGEPEHKASVHTIEESDNLLQGVAVVSSPPATLPSIESTAMVPATDGEAYRTTPLEPEPTSLARKIQEILSYFSVLAYSSSFTSSTSDGTTTPASITDSNLIGMLSSPSVMNGSLARGRQSVWSALDRLRLRPGNERLGEGERAEDNNNTTEEERDDNESVMLYGPLLPMADSQVELAQSEIISTDDVRPAVAEPARVQPHNNGIWPFTSWTGTMWRGSGDNPQSSPDSDPVRETRIWVPSTTQISLQIMWWGYRIYLPPPVLATLDNKHIETGKRAALISTALKWLLEHIPATLVPVQFRPVLRLVKGLVPYLAYIGIFVAWSWTAIKAFDKGYGVTLTATWLLTLALIPGTWEPDDFPDIGTTSASDGNAGTPR